MFTNLHKVRRLECKAIYKAGGVCPNPITNKPGPSFLCGSSQTNELVIRISAARVYLQLPTSVCPVDLTHPVEYWEHHVELLLLLLLGHVARRVAQLGEEAAQVHEAQSVVLGAALLLPRPPHDPLHHVHL